MTDIIENQNAETNANDEVEVNITEQETVEASSDDELEKYTRSVSKRVNKLNDKIKREAEKSAYLEQQLQAKEQENLVLKNQTVSLGQSYLDKEEEALESKQREVEDIYRQALQANDADTLSKADTLKNDIAIQKEKIRVAKQRQQVAGNNYQQPVYQQPAQQQAQPQKIEPTKEALSWHEQNKWYGDQDNPENAQATQFAYFTHFNLVNEGFEADSDDYYEELNTRVGKVYPNLVNSGNVGQNEGRPAVQRVASTSAGSSSPLTRSQPSLSL